MVAAYLFRVSEYRSERLARVQFLRGLRILGVHVNDEVRVRRKKSHLTFRIATVRAMCVSFNEFADSETIRGFLG
jgi:hypothetical protein